MDKIKRSELRTAKEFGAWRQTGSGNQREASKKGDIRLHFNLRIEQKDTIKDKYVLKARDLDTIWKQSVGSLELPIFLIRSKEEDLVILDKNDFDEMTQYHVFNVNESKNYNVGNKVDTYHINKQKTIDLPKVVRNLTDTVVAYIDLVCQQRTYVMLLKAWLTILLRDSRWSI